jgi:hypothetical protein
MTTLQQTHPPVLCYEIWEYDNETLGSLIDWKPWWQAKQDYEICYDIQGKAAHFVLVTHDLSIHRSEAIAFAKAVYENKVRHTLVDLIPCNPNRKK